MNSLFEYNLVLLDGAKSEREYSNIFYDKYTSAEQKVSDIDFEEIKDSGKYGDYLIWMDKYKRLLLEYANFLRYCDINPNKYRKEAPIELFKGSFDSLKNFFGRLGVCSKYAATFNAYGNSPEIILNDITVRDGVPTYKLLTEFGNTLYIPTNTDKHNKYYVHNPYDKNEERKILRLLENDSISVIYGEYGFPQEDDIETRIDKLKQLKSELEGAKFFELRKENNNLGEYHIGVLYKALKR